MVERHFRDALARGELTAYVHHPVTGERLKLLNRDHWDQQGQIPGITSNFTQSLTTSLCPGPDSTLLGKRRPVVVITEELKRRLVPIGEPERKIPRKQEVGKRPLIKQYLSERFPIEKFPNGVPSPAFFVPGMFCCSTYGTQAIQH